MSSGYETVPDDLAAAAARFDEAVRSVADALTALRTTLGGLGDVVGTDEQGRAFAARYDPTAAQGVTAIDGAAAALGSLGAALRASAADYAAQEGAAAAAFPPR